MYDGVQAPLLPEQMPTSLLSSWSRSLQLPFLSLPTFDADPTVPAYSDETVVSIPSISTDSTEYNSLSPTSSELGSPSCTSVVVVSPTESADPQSQMQLCASITFLSTLASFVTTGGLLHWIDQREKPKYEERKDDPSWIASSSSWIDRTLCRTIGICGLTHLNKAYWRTGLSTSSGFHNTSSFWTSGVENPDDWSDEERQKREIPQYVLDHAPYVHLFSSETYWPGDIAEHLLHTTANLNYTPAPEKYLNLDLTDLHKLNVFGPKSYLTSNDNVEDNPDWLLGEQNIPDKHDVPFALPPGASHQRAKIGKWKFNPENTKYDDPDFNKFYSAGIDDSSNDKHSELKDWRSFHVQNKRSMQSSSEKMFHLSAGGRSNAPVVMLIVDKGNDVVDAFWFYFYSYNLGNQVFSVRFGNHVGDWEHTAIRFHKGEPKLVFFSEHDFGEAYSWEAVEKYGDRPVSYSAVGTHAMYGTPGTHTYVLPFGILYDVTDRGPLWDPLLNMYAYTYDYQTDEFRSSTLNPYAPTSWFYYWGHWGDKFYPLSDPRQYRFVGQYHYVSGPTGPRYKHLGRKHICQGLEEEPCNIRTWFAGARDLPKEWRPLGEDEDLSEEDVRKFAYANREMELRRAAAEDAFNRAPGWN